MSDRKTCKAQVSEPPGYWHTHTCGRPAKGMRDGNPVCGIHLRSGYVNWVRR